MDEGAEQNCLGNLQEFGNLSIFFVCFHCTSLWFVFTVSEKRLAYSIFEFKRFTCSQVSFFFPTAGSLGEPAGCSCDVGTRAGTQFWHESRHPGARLRLQDDRGPRRLHHDSLDGVSFGFYAARKP